MRGDHHAVEAEERRLGGGLLFEHVEARALHVAGLDGFGEVGLDHDATSGGVDDANARLGLGHHGRVDQAHGLRVLGQVDRDEVRAAHDVLEAHELDAHVPGAVLGDDGVVSHEAHAEGEGTLGEQGADATEADDAHGLAVELHALPLGALPLAVDQRHVGLRHVAGLGQQQGDGLLGGRDDVGLRGVDPQDTELGGPSDVDVVEADAGPADDDQVGPGLEHLGGDRGGRADDEGMGPHDGPEELLRAQAELDVDLVAGGSQLVEARLGDLLGNEDSCHVAPWVRCWFEGGRAGVRRGQSASAKSRWRRPTPSMRSSSPRA